jgi:hypothetical protein
LIKDGQLFEGAQKILINYEIKSRIAAGKRCVYRLSQIFRYRAMSIAGKIKIIYQTVVRPAVVFGGGKWAVAELDMNRLGIWKRKILRRIYGPVVEQVIWTKITYQELREIKI